MTDVSNKEVLTTDVTSLNWNATYINGYNSLYNVCYGNNKMVVVGDSGKIHISYDGITWTTINKVLSGDIKAVCYKNNIFVAVGSDSYIAYSSDGITWNKTLTRANYYSDICYGNGMFVAVTGNGYICTSSDGIIWTEYNPNNSYAYYLKVHYSKGAFIAIAGSGIMMTSIDGVIWSNVITGTSKYLYQIRSCNGKIIVVGDNGFVMTSDDGENWIINELGGYNNLKDVYYYNGIYIIVGYGGTVFTSTDAITWIKQIIGNGSYIDTMCCGDGLFVIGDNNGCVYISEDAVVWNKHETSYRGSFKFAEYINGMFILGGNNSIIITSGTLGEPTDEIINTKPTMITSLIHNADSKKTVGDRVIVSWDESIDAEGDTVFYDLCFYDGDSWIVIARNLIENSYTHIISENYFNTTEAKYKVRSGDGDLYNDFVESDKFTIYGALRKYIWEINESGTFNSLQSMVYNNGLYVAVGSNGIILTSTDTITWTQRTSGVDNTVYSIAYGNGIYIAVCSGKRILTSTDTITWMSKNTNSYVYRVAYGNGVFVMVGDNGTILSSVDGVTWTPRTASDSYSFYYVYYVNDKFIIACYDNIYISYDGISWVKRQTGLNLQYFAYGKGLYIGITYSGTVATSTDCVVWTQVDKSPSNGNYYGIIYTGDLFICLSSVGNISTSKDGVIWNAQPCPAKLMAICYNNGLLVSVGADGIICTTNITLNSEITPISITHNATTKKILNDSVVINWVDADDLNGHIMNYDLYFYNGISWILLQKSIYSNTYTHIITDVVDNTIVAKYKVMANDTSTGEISNYIESDVFEILINAVPEPVTFITHNAIGKKTTKGVIKVTWDNAYDELGKDLVYELSFFNGADWSVLATNSELSYTHTLHYVFNTTNAKYRVRAYNGKYYSEYLESSVFETYINSAPYITSITHNATNKKRIGDEVIVNWSEAVDIDGDNITYDLYFYDGKEWVQLLIDTTVITYTHTIPQLTYNTSISRYKVVAYDGVDYGDFVESSVFEIYDAYNSTPIITTENKDLGKLEKVPYFSYKVNDRNKDDNLSASVYLDRHMLDFIGDIERGQAYSVDFSNMWDSLSVGKHTLRISAYDGTEYTNKIYDFTKIIYQTPTISGYNANLGYQDSSFIQSYVVKDEYENTPLTVIESVDSTVFNTIANALRDNTYSIDLSSVWDSLSIGIHKITIKVIDRFENGETRIFNFYKKEKEEENTSIDGSDMYLGVKYTPFYCNFAVDDSNVNDKINVSVYLNNEIIDQTYNAIRGFKYNIGINSKLFNKLENDATHTIQIVASDGIAITTKNYMFKKKDLLEDHIVLDVKFESLLPIIDCKQNNNIALKFKIQYLGEDINLANYKVMFKALKPNGDIFISKDIIKNSNGKVMVLCNSRLSDVKGIVKCQIQLTDKNGKQKNTQSFNLRVITV